MFTLGRKIDFSYKTNLLILILVVVVSAVGWLVTGEISSGISLGGSVFLTWALCREIDPAHDYSAFVAVALSLLMLFNIETIQLFPLFWLLMLLRAVNGISGKELTLIDLVTLLGFTVYIAFVNENSLYLLLFVLGMAFISFTDEKTKKVLLAGLIGFVLLILQTFFVNQLSLNNIADLDTMNLLVIAASALSTIVFWFISRVEAECDQGTKANPSRIFACQLLFSISVLMFVFFTDITFANQILYLAIIGGVSFYFVGVRIFINK